jgi:hypothetical protein
MCIPHVINLSSQNVIAMVSNLDPDADQDEQFNLVDETNHPDLVGLVRLIVVKIRASGQRRDAFQSTI